MREEFFGADFGWIWLRKSRFWFNSGFLGGWGCEEFGVMTRISVRMKRDIRVVVACRLWRGGGVKHIISYSVPA